MEERIAIIECVVAVISLIISVVALVQAHKQVKISNKQNLFNSRVGSYLIVTGLIKLYEENKQFIEGDKDDEIYYSSDFVLACLINNSYLEKMGAAIGKPLHQPEQKEFLRKVEELKNEALRIKYTFYGEESDILSSFVNSYADVLMGLYQYTVLMDTMRKIQDEMPKKYIKDVARDVKEIEYRESLYSKFETLSKVYSEIRSKDIIKNIEKQIKLR